MPGKGQMYKKPMKSMAKDEKMMTKKPAKKAAKKKKGK